MLHQLFSFLCNHDIQNHHERMQKGNFPCQHTARCKAILQVLFLWCFQFQNLLTRIHRSPSFGKPHRHLVCPNDRHTPSSRFCCSKLAPDPHAVIVHLINELTKKIEKKHKDLKNGHFSISAHLGAVSLACESVMTGGPKSIWNVCMAWAEGAGYGQDPPPA